MESKKAGPKVRGTNGTLAGPWTVLVHRLQGPGFLAETNRRPIKGKAG